MAYSGVQDLLRRHSVSYIDKGSNVQNGNINIKCPLCSNDPSYHMGISLETGYWGCWRSSKHRGKDLFYLLTKVLHIDYKTVAASLPKYSYIKRRPAEDYRRLIKLEFPRGFVDPLSTNYNIRLYDAYLHKRGFCDLPEFIKRYGIRYALSGTWAGRIIFPIHKDGNLIAWQGRSIFKKTTLAYKDLSIQQAVIHPKRFLYNYDAIKTGGTFLYLTEGVFDALKLDYYSPVSIRATCFFTKTISQEQLEVIYDLKNRFCQFRLCLDSDALPQALYIKKKLSFLRSKIKIVRLPEGVKDPGQLSPEEIKKWMN